MTPNANRGASGAISTLRHPAVIRDRCQNILAAVQAGRSDYFDVDLGALAAVADCVAEVTRQNYPDLIIPYHSRWRHFEAGGVDRKAQLDLALEGLPAADVARARIDLTLVSVLLDAGAGADWHYLEEVSSQSFVRSEGLGVASFHGFMNGMFSSNPERPYQVDGKALVAMDNSTLEAMFQVSPDNPLVGLEGRATLLNRLGESLLSQPQVFGIDGRPGGLFDALVDTSKTLAAADVLRALLDTLSPVWLAGNYLDEQPLGDCWQHELAGGDAETAGWVPFHKLSQWLTYSLLEPFQWAGVSLTGLDDLTGLPEYRNGGLLLDLGVIKPKVSSFCTDQHPVSSPAIIEWRALTVALLDQIAPLVRERLAKTAEQMPLACVLEGGTWAAGRAVARKLRPGGPPPVNIISDGTVF